MRVPVPALVRANPLALWPIAPLTVAVEFRVSVRLAVSVTGPLSVRAPLLVASPSVTLPATVTGLAIVRAVVLLLISVPVVSVSVPVPKGPLVGLPADPVVDTLARTVPPLRLKPPENVLAPEKPTALVPVLMQRPGAADDAGEAEPGGSGAG